MKDSKQENGKVEQSLKDSSTLLINSIVGMKCPGCRKGHLFVRKNPYAFRDSLKMPDFCRVCGQDFKIEPGFYIGALWTSFPIVILIMALFSILLLVMLGISLEWFFVAITTSLLALQPLIIRLGRSIWIHIFVGFKLPSDT